jgi:hypothetical protein
MAAAYELSFEDEDEESTYSSNSIVLSGDYMPNKIRTFLLDTYRNVGKNSEEYKKIKELFANIESCKPRMFLTIEGYRFYSTEGIDFYSKKGIDGGNNEKNIFYKIKNSNNIWQCEIFPHSNFTVDEIHNLKDEMFSKIVHTLIARGEFKINYNFNGEYAFTVKINTSNFGRYLDIKQINMQFEMKPQDDDMNTKPAIEIPLSLSSGGRRNYKKSRKTRKRKTSKRSLKMRKHKSSNSK